MIPIIRSLSELMALTNARDKHKSTSKNAFILSPKVDSLQSKRYIRPFEEKVNLPNLPKTIRHKWIQRKQSISRFIDDLDYNNQIQSTYDLTLLERQNRINQRDLA